jgi:hypothetical protein
MAADGSGIQEFGGGFPGPNCFKMITIEYQGKSTQAQITDEVRSGFRKSDPNF